MKEEKKMDRRKLTAANYSLVDTTPVEIRNFSSSG